jgi:phosphopantetheinyl transferase
MPLFYQQNINEGTKLGVWKVEEPETFFLEQVPLQRSITHPHKRLQHLAGRYLLHHLFPGFPYALIQVADTRKPFLPGDAFHFSISHCGDYAAAIVSTEHRVGIDVEIPTEKIRRIAPKFLSDPEQDIIRQHDNDLLALTACWSAKEAVFKWFGDGVVDFRGHIHLHHFTIPPTRGTEGQITCVFDKLAPRLLPLHYKCWDDLVLAWLIT